MKRFFFLVVLSLASFHSFAQQGKVTLEIEIQGLKNRNGHLLIDLYDSEENYMKQAVVNRTYVLADSDSTLFTVSDIEPGNYAVTVLQDDNMNGEIDFGAMGPVELYGFANNPPSLFGPAKFSKALIEIREDRKITIKLH